MSDRITDQMRPCVREGFKKGACDRDHFDKMRFALIFELNRLHIDKSKIKTALLEWNQRNFKRLSENEAKRQLCGYVDWFFLRECNMSCKTLNAYCLHQNGGCEFKRASSHEQVSLPFSLTEMEGYVEKECKPHGYLMACLVKNLFKIQRNRGIGGRVFVGYRTLQEMILDEYNHKIDLMTISRTTRILENEKILRITHGKSGDLRRKANGYTFLPWVPPSTHITHMCNRSEQKEDHYCVTPKDEGKNSDYCVTTSGKITDADETEPHGFEIQYSDSPFLKEGRLQAIKQYLDKNKILYDDETVREIEKKLTPQTKIEDLLPKEQARPTEPVNSPKSKSIILRPDGRYTVKAAVWPNYKKQWTSPVPCEPSIAEDKLHEMINALKAQKTADKKAEFLKELSRKKKA